MGSSARALLSTLPKGHELSPASFRLTRDDVASYLAAVGDTNALYANSGLAPPLAVAARALSTLLEVLELPEGTLHAGQEVDVRAGVPLDSEPTLSGRVAQRSERGGMVVCVLEFNVRVAGHVALSGKTTVLTPPAGPASGA